MSFFVLGPAGLTVSLSYWPPNSTELATGITTPPVLLTNSGGIAFFFKHYHVDRTMNLFVTFTEGEHSSASLGYTTPRRFCEEGSGSASDSVMRNASVRSFSSLGSGFETPIFGRKKQCSPRDTSASFGRSSFSHEQVGCNTPLILRDNSYRIG